MIRFTIELTEKENGAVALEVSGDVVPANEEPGKLESAIANKLGFRLHDMLGELAKEMGIKRIVQEHPPTLVNKKWKEKEEEK